MDGNLIELQIPLHPTFSIAHSEFRLAIHSATLIPINSLFMKM